MTFMVSGTGIVSYLRTVKAQELKLWISVASKVQGAPFAEFIRTGNIGKFMGFLACLIQASFTIAGPEYVSMTAGEAVGQCTRTH